MPDQELTDVFVGRLPTDLRKLWTSQRMKGETFLRVTEVVNELQADHVRKMDREGDSKDARKSSREDFRRSRNRADSNSKRGASNRSYSRHYDAGSRAPGNRPFKLSPCRNCGGVGHLSQDCANLKGTKAPPYT